MILPNITCPVSLGPVDIHTIAATEAILFHDKAQRAQCTYLYISEVQRGQRIGGINALFY